MRCAYWDSSAIVKLAHAERESKALLDYLDAPVQASTSVLSEVEVRRALRRQGCDPTDVDEALKGFYLLHLETDIRRLATSMNPLSIRSLDAIHMASALTIGDPDLEFVTYDDRLAEAARLHGLRVVQPGRDAGEPAVAATRADRRAPRPSVDS